LGDFDNGPRYYNLGDYTDLGAVIEQYQGSFGRASLAHRGYNASSVFSLWWADRQQCQAKETPLACEYRLHRPVLVLVMLGTNDVWHLDTFDGNMRRIIEFSLENGVLPVLATKADNAEGDGRINATIAGLAWEYDLPLWNFWAAVQPLPDHGMLEDQIHLTWGPNRFDQPRSLQRAWTIRNLTALQVLDALWRSL
jgi:hypothetical protein